MKLILSIYIGMLSIANLRASDLSGDLRILGNNIIQSLKADYFNYESTVNDDYKELLFDPSIKLDQSNGSFHYSLKLPLVPSLASLKNIHIEYNSAVKQESIFGHGWSHNLPKISKNNKFKALYGKDAWTVSGAIGNFDLVKVGGISDEIASYLEKSTNKSISRNASLWRPYVDETFHTFVKSQEKWLGVLKNGDIYVFNEYGTLSEVFVKGNLALSFDWDGKNLQQIRTNDGYTQIFKYEAISRFSSRLKKMTLSGINGEKEVYEFTYFNNQLSKVLKQGSDFPIFEGEYQYYSQMVMPPEDTNTWFGEDRFQQEYKKGKQFIPKDHIFEIDLNGDGKFEKRNLGLWDFLIYHFKDGGHDFGIWERGITEAITFLGDQYKSKTDQIPLKGDYKTAIGEYILEDRFSPFSNTYDGKTQKNKVYYIDIDSDGNKDLISCRHTFEGKSFDDDLIKSNHPLYLNYLSLTNTSGAPNDFPSSSKFEPSLVKKVIWNKFTNATVMNFESNLKCNEYTFFIDFNSDGHIDALNGLDLQLNDGHGFFEEVTLNTEEFTAIFVNKVNTVKENS